MKHYKVTLILALLCTGLIACAAPPARTAQAVVDQLAAAGLDTAGAAPGVRAPDSPLPNTAREWLAWESGQVFVCDTKPNCDAIYDYFDTLRVLAGPYLYRSTDGRVVVQLSSTLAPDVAVQAEAVVREL